MNCELKTVKRGGGRPKKPQTRIPSVKTVRGKGDNGVGLPAEINRLRQAALQAHDDYQSSLSTRDAALISHCRKNWLDLVEQLRKVESSTPEIQRANCESLPVIEVETECSRMVSAFRVALEVLPRSLPQKLFGQDLPTMEEILKTAVNDALDQIHTTSWRIQK